MTNKKKKGLIAGIIILLFLAGASIFIAAAPLYKYVMKYDETDIVEYQAKAVDFISNESSYEINISEFSCALVIKKAEVVNETKLFALHYNDDLIFIIPKFYEEPLMSDSTKSIPVLSLKINGTDIVTLESHRAMEEKSYSKVRITAAVFATLFICGSAACLGVLLKTKTES